MATLTMRKSDGPIELSELDVYDLIVAGTFKLAFFHSHKKTKKTKRMFSFWLNTALMPKEGSLALPKSQLDGAANNKKSFDSDFEVTIQYEPADTLGGVTEEEIDLSEKSAERMKAQCARYLETLEAGGQGAEIDDFEEEMDEDEFELEAHTDSVVEKAASTAESTRAAAPPLKARGKSRRSSLLQQAASGLSSSFRRGSNVS